MAPGALDPRDLETTQRLRDQLGHFKDAVAWDADPPYGPGLIYVPDQVLVDTAVLPEVRRVIRGRGDIFVGQDAENVTEPLPRLSQVTLPGSLNNNGKPDVLEAIKAFDETIPPGAVTPNHVLHLTSDGHSRICPATEPEETGLEDHWPEKNTRPDAGQGVRVAVIDTGDYPLGRQPGNLPLLGVYDGHARFVEGVLHDRAPLAKIELALLPMPGGGLDEVTIAQKIIDIAGTQRPKRQRPHIISLSAGCYTYNNQGLAAFWNLRTNALKGQDVVLVCAAGNDSFDRKFYPAAFGWAVGVGSLDHNGKVSSFSNYGPWVDIYALGRNLVNVYPYGRYVCAEAPNKGDKRRFDTGLARWSGTSFATPLVAGLIAARMSVDQQGAKAARDAVLADSLTRTEAPYGKYQYLRRTKYLPAYP